LLNFEQPDRMVFPFLRTLPPVVCAAIVGWPVRGLSMAPIRLRIGAKWGDPAG
jgi:hypothetical protein